MVGINSYSYLHQFLSKSGGYRDSISSINYQLQNKSKALDLADIGKTKINPYIGSRVMTEKSELYISNIKSALNRLDLYEEAFNEFDRVVTDLLGATPAGLDEAERMNLEGVGFNYLLYMQDLLNTKEDADSYLFHGKDGRRSWETINFGRMLGEYNEEYYGFNKLLDDVPGAKLAYSTRQLTDTYTGPLIQVRRADTGAILDVGFYDNGNFDYQTITAWLSEDDPELYVTKWYDQSGTGNDLEVTNPAQQPRLKLRSEHDYTYSKGPAIIFDGVDDKMLTETILDVGGYSDILGDSDRSVLMNMNATAGGKQVMGYGDMFQEHGAFDVNLGASTATYRGNWELDHGYGDAGFQTGFHGSAWSEVGVQNGSDGLNTVQLHQWEMYAMRYENGVAGEYVNYGNETTSTINGGLGTNVSAPSTPYNLEVGDGVMDAGTQPAANYFMGDMAELIILPDDLTEADAGTIESNIRDYDWSDNTTKVLDALPASVPNAKMAYGLRQLNSSYTGDIVQLRFFNPTPVDWTTGWGANFVPQPIYDSRNSSPPQDFGLDASGNLDIPAILAWSSGNSQYLSISKWYDQSGNVPSNDLVSSADPAVSNPPRFIIDGGTSARIVFNGQFMQGENPLDNTNYSEILGGSDRTVFTKMRATEANRQVMGIGSTNAAYGTFDVAIGDGGDLGVQTGYLGPGTTIGDSSIEDGNNQLTLNSWETYSARYSGGTVYESIDGGAETASAITVNTVPDPSNTPQATSNIRIGDGYINSALPTADYYQGALTELVIYGNRLDDAQMDTARTNVIEYRLPWGDYGAGTPFPDIVINPEILPDDESGNSNNKRNLSPYNTYYDYGTHAGRYYNTERDYEMRISDTHTIDVDWSPYEAFIQNIVYGVEIIAKSVGSDPLNVDPSNPGVAYEESIAEGKAFLETARDQLKQEIAELNTKRNRLLERQEAHESDISFYTSLLDSFDKPEDDAELTAKLNNIYNAVERSYTITSSLSKSNLMNFLFF
ncbi:MAG: arabinofuranosidase catalytic domain-containing protein [Alphaproteobacteria bacterium]